MQPIVGIIQLFVYILPCILLFHVVAICAFRDKHIFRESGALFQFKWDFVSVNALMPKWWWWRFVPCCKKEQSVANAVEVRQGREQIYEWTVLYKCYNDFLSVFEFLLCMLQVFLWLNVMMMVVVGHFILLFLLHYSDVSFFLFFYKTNSFISRKANAYYLQQAKHNVYCCDLMKRRYREQVPGRNCTLQKSNARSKIDFRTLFFFLVLKKHFVSWSWI